MKFGKALSKIVLILIIAFSVIAVTACKKDEKASAGADEKKIKAGFVYVGPVGDYGWSHAHHVGKEAVEEKYP